jgi:Sugar (and other) transporter
VFYSPPVLCIQPLNNFHPDLERKPPLTNPVCVFTVVQITPIAISNISWRTFIIFAVFCALWVPIVYCFFPETNQLKLEDIDHLFEGGGVFRAKGWTVEPEHHERAHGGEAGEKEPRFGGQRVEVEERV